ncbi:2-hydroxy-3-oxopropionate reductase [Variibacter gotjawalensis]|uniref:2-hydroxy-3-oxopropionate reductase n=1 Tax=Variibacter gotjawalensis TaxID=1333996 RepID=A0A0S3PXS8_9BRAD|nr:NAD(P)-dependent oxidoreductase [Variibacter gotjawalensis]NIK46552.1 2-hydroxy-3-oxopropionate reductase [Variibacter gotjawalensis]RZS48457.1 3-hydroxyisobutyrate dehydrogenase-like beta-hydroxyacid dehydrogenase [Variibacter gotjawalensis]BAT60718.1 2-hydroxy-3-oxopropionate reductase [Variibacter gotjawalensis]
MALQTASPGKTKVGYIGLGVMGAAMVRNILKAGFSVTVHNRSRAIVDELVKEGAIAAASPADVANACDVVMMCVPDTPDVDRVIFGDNGVATHARADLIVVDFSTIAASATKDFAARLSEKGTYLVDCPVSGGPKGAVDGALTCMLGGEAAAVEAVMPILKAVGKTHVHLGPAGSGQLTKSCNQLVIAATLAGVSEAIALAKSAGVDPYKMRDALLGGSAQSFVLQNHAMRLLNRELKPGFRSSLMLKDMKLAQGAGRDNGVFMPVTNVTTQIFTGLCNTEHKEADSASYGLLIQDLSGVK